ncbi:MAG TPA: tol-pal system-associated acyl-CoA thioesterase [Methylophilaceae bacterium]|nr:tol-pal system-associated acyl-CoA thioesterase [Methylophilaceae bacterium]
MFQWPVRVYYEDTDAGGVVYHSQYLNFMERARTEWLRHLGFEQTYLRESLNVLFVVHSMQIQFKKPARFDDMLMVSNHLIAIGHGSFTCQQLILKETQTLIEAQVKVACVNALNFKPTGIPAPIKHSMESA